MRNFWISSIIWAAAIVAIKIEYIKHDSFHEYIGWQHVKNTISVDRIISCSLKLSKYLAFVSNLEK
jgi:hypothetical protein